MKIAQFAASLQTRLSAVSAILKPKLSEYIIASKRVATRSIDLWRGVPPLYRIVTLVLLFVMLFYTISSSAHRMEIAAIERVLTSDRGASANVTSVEHVIQNMRAIDLAGCPVDFKTAYLDHVHAWTRMRGLENDAKLFQDRNSGFEALLISFMRGAVGDFGSVSEYKSEQQQLLAQYKEAREAVEDTFLNVERIAVSHGAAIPPRDAPQQPEGEQD